MILVAPNNARTVGGIVAVSTSTITPDDDGRYVLKKGTPVYGNDLSKDRQTALTLSGDTLRGLVLKDVPFRKGETQVNATIMIAGTVDIATLDYTVRAILTSDIQKKLVNIEFINGGKSEPALVKDKTAFETALKAGGTVILESDITGITEGIEINKDTTIDLNGKSIRGAASTSIALLRAIGSTLTITGNGTIECSDGYTLAAGRVSTEAKGNIIVESGNITGATTAVHVYRGKAEIKGGTFKLSNAGGTYGNTYLLNRQDDSVSGGKGVIVVTGGTYYGFNPASNDADDKDSGGKTNYVASGYKSVEDKSQNTWTVVKA